MNRSRMYSFNSFYKQCLMMIAMLMFGSVHALPKSICDYPLEDIPGQIVNVYEEDQLTLINKDLTIFELKQVNWYSFVTSSVMAMKDKWPKLYRNPTFAYYYKDTNFETPLFGYSPCLSFAVSHTNTNVTLFEYDLSLNNAWESNFKPTYPLDGIFSKESIWMATGVGEIYHVLQQVQGNYRFKTVIFNWFQEYRNGTIEIQQGPYMCRQSSEKDDMVVYSDDPCTNAWDDKVLKAHYQTRTCVIFAQKQVYLCNNQHAFDFPLNLTAISYNRFFSCGHPEPTLSGPVAQSSTNNSSIAVLTTGKSGFPVIAVIMIIVVVILAVIVLLVVVFFSCYKQDKPASRNKKPSTRPNVKKSLKRQSTGKQAAASSAKVSSKAAGSIANSRRKQLKGKQSKASKF